MIIKNLETNLEIELVSKMSASSDAQNQHLAYQLAHQEIELPHCFIMKEEEHIVARAVIEHNFITYLTFEAISIHDAEMFIHHIIMQYPNKALTCHLYSDKTNFELTKQSLLKHRFHIIQHKISNTIKPQQKAYHLRYEDADTLSKEHMVHLLEQVNTHSLDDEVIHQIKENGAKKAAQDLYEDLILLEKKKGYWFIAYDHDTIIGFTIISVLADKTAGIGYIGVLPMHRGHHYIDDLLNFTIHTCWNYHIEKLIEDTDVKNQPMLMAVKRCGFQKDCDQLVMMKE